MKNVGVPETPLSSALRHVLADPRRVLALAQLVGEPLDVESELLGVAGEVALARARPGG